MHASHYQINNLSIAQINCALHSSHMHLITRDVNNKKYSHYITINRQSLCHGHHCMKSSATNEVITVVIYLYHHIQSVDKEPSVAK